MQQLLFVSGFSLTRSSPIDGKLSFRIDVRNGIWVCTMPWNPGNNLAERIETKIGCSEEQHLPSNAQPEIRDQMSVNMSWHLRQLD